MEYGTRSGWVPGVYVEDDPAAQQALEDEYGQSVSSGYMSEECGWDVSDDDEVMDAIVAMLERAGT